MSGKHILAFEADPLYANLLSEALGTHGYQVDIVSEGVEGLDKAGAAPPDLIYLCVELPRISGFSICNKIKKNGALKDIPLIITSSEATDETFEKHKRLKGHGDEYLHKPFSGEEIAAVVDALLAGVTTEDGEFEDGDDLEEIVIDDDDAVELESEGELNDFDDLDDMDGSAEVEEVSFAKPLDSDISALADRAFDGLEMKDDPSSKEDVPRPSLSGPEVAVMPEPEGETEDEDLPTDASDSRPRSESILPSAPGAADKLKEQNKELKKKLETLEKQLIAAKSSKKSGVSSSEFLDLREALNNKDRELLDLKDGVNSKEKEVLNLRDKINGLERQKADLEDKNIDVYKQLNQLEHQLETLGVDHEHLTQKFAEMERNIAELEENKTAVEENLAEEKSGRARDLQNEKAAAAEALEAQRVEMETAANQRREAELLAKQTEHDEAVEALNTALNAEKDRALAALNDEYTAKIDELNKAHTNRENELSGRIVAEQDIVKRLEGEKAALTHELEQVRQSLENTMKQLDITQHTLKETGEAFEAEQQAHTETQATLADTQRQLAEQTARGDGLDTVKADLEGQIAALHTEVEELTALIQRNEEISDKARKAAAIAVQLLEDLESISDEDMEEAEAEDEDA